MNLYYISNLSQNSKLRTSSGLPSDSAELFPLLFCRLNEIIWEQSIRAKEKNLSSLPGSQFGNLELPVEVVGKPVGPSRRCHTSPAASTWTPLILLGISTLETQTKRYVLLTARDEVRANFCCLVMVGILKGKLCFCWVCMHASVEKVLLWVFCAPWREMRMKVVGICRKELRGVLRASLLTAFVGSVIGFTQTSGCPLLAGDPDARWKSPARSGADPEVP